MLSHKPWETAVGTPSLRLKGYPLTKSAPSLNGSYKVLKKWGVDGHSKFFMCCSSALMSAPLGSFATYADYFKISPNTNRVKIPKMILEKNSEDDDD